MSSVLKTSLRVVALVALLAFLGLVHFAIVHYHVLSPNGVFRAGSDLKGQSLAGRVSPKKPESEEIVMRKLNATLTKLKSDLINLHSRLHLPDFPHDKQQQPPISSLQSQQKPAVVQISTLDSPKSVAKAAPTVAATAISATIKKRAVIFTMDCLASYEQGSRQGGAAGELIIRYALAEAFASFGVSLRIIRSDGEFDNLKMDDYDIILLDTWTWATKGWVPKRNLIGHEGKVYILDFFGSPSLRNNEHALHLPPTRILTAFKSPWNSFLGYYIPADRVDMAKGVVKKQRGVIWGKDPKHYEGKQRLLSVAAAKAILVSTASEHVVGGRGFEWRGHQTPEQWLQLLAESKFLIGLGNPLLGPSAADAVSLGCMFLNPVYKTPAHIAKYESQHPFIAEAAPDYVCSYAEGDESQLLACIDRALKADLLPFIPPELTQESYMKRVQQIFGL